MKYQLKRIHINWRESQAIAKAKKARTELEQLGFRYIKTNYMGREAEMLYSKN